MKILWNYFFCCYADISTDDARAIVASYKHVNMILGHGARPNVDTEPSSRGSGKKKKASVTKNGFW